MALARCELGGYSDVAVPLPCTQTAHGRGHSALEPLGAGRGPAGGSHKRPRTPSPTTDQTLVSLTPPSRHRLQQARGTSLHGQLASHKSARVSPWRLQDRIVLEQGEIERNQHQALDNPSPSGS